LYEATSGKTEDGYSRPSAKRFRNPPNYRKSLFLKKDKLRVSVPYHNKDLKPGTLASIIAQAGLTVKEFVDLL